MKILLSFRIWLYGILICCFWGTSIAKEVEYTEKEKQLLIHMARKTIESYLKNGFLPDFKQKNLPKALLQHRACFVTLNKKGWGLRGCMGLFERTRPLYQNIMNRAVTAATQDPRFPKVIG